MSAVAEHARQNADPSRPAVRPPPAETGEGISVVVPCWNAAETLDRALSSLTAQTFADWEAIVVDDGSQDGSVRLAERWAARDKRITVVRQPHAGAAAARNRGLDRATRPWICFLDADDWLSPRAFERWLRLAANAPEAAVLVGRSVRVAEDGRRWAWPRRDLGDAFGVLCAECAIPIHSALARRSAVLAVGAFDAGLRTNEDWDLWQRLARAGLVFAQTGDFVAYYRSRPGSLSRDLTQTTADGLEVMRRGHAADPRVPDAPQAYARGAAADALAPRQLYYVLWAAARDIAIGGDGLAIAALLPTPVEIDFEPDAVGELMAAGVADMLAVHPTAAGRRWPELGPRFQRLLATVYPDPARARLVALALAAIKAALNGGDPDEADALRLGTAEPPALTGRSDFAVLQLRAGDRTLGAVALPMLGPLSGAELAQQVTAQVGALPLTRALLAARPWRSAAFWTACGGAMLAIRGLGLRAAVRRPRRLAGLLRGRVRHALRAGLQAAVAAGLSRLASCSADTAHATELQRLRAEAAALPDPRPGDRPPTPREPTAPWPGELAPVAAWDAFFASHDEWNRASEYERLKFDDTLELVPELPPGASALELACAEGHFTQLLATQVGRLLATDISPTALERARARCRGFLNVSFEPLDFVRQPISGRYDLILCSEALYYAGARLPLVARKLAASLKPGGWLVMTHSAMISDEPDATGFDWGHEHGARSIGELFQALPGLCLEREIRRPLYRVQRFRRSDDPPLAPRLEARPLDVPLERSVARSIVWGGGVSRLACFRREMALAAPILMYHRVSPWPTRGLERYCVHPGRFEEQIAHLRRNGYWGVTPEDLRRALRDNIPLPGRPVMLTFDDGYADFAEHAWPVLQRHDFTATVFVVADAVGGRAEWDAGFGRPAALMDWDTLAELSAAGVRIESHCGAHRPLTRSGVRQAYRDVLRGAALIEKATGRAPRAFCYPYGAHDRVSVAVVRECGAELAFTSVAGAATLASDPLRLPRIEVSGSDDLQSFSRKLGR